MRTSTFALVILILCAAFRNKEDNTEYLLRLSVQENNFFTVKALLQNAKGNIAEEQLLYYRALAQNRFNQCDSSNLTIDELLTRYRHSLDDSTIVELLDTRVSNYLRLYQYKQAAAACSEILSSYGEQLDSTKIKAYQNTHYLFAALSDVPSQTMTTTKDETIAAHRNKFNHLMIPVKTHSIAADFIFDSGAGLSTISESYAKKMNLRTVEGSVSVGSATTINVTSKLAVADSLFVGGIEFRNVVFLVLPDEKLSIPQVGLVINGIIGFPVMYQMGEIHMHKDGTIFVPRVPQDRHLNNLFLDNQVPIIAANSDNDTLLFNMDTGAKTTEFSKKYYDSHKASVEKNGRKMTRHFGGAGGITKLEIYELPAVTLTIGTQRAHLKKVPVMLSDHKFTKNTDGNLGQDVITQFNEMVLNFKYMYVDFGAAD